MDNLYASRKSQQLKITKYKERQTGYSGCESSLISFISSASSRCLLYDVAFCFDFPPPVRGGSSLHTYIYIPTGASLSLSCERFITVYMPGCPIPPNDFPSYDPLTRQRAKREFVGVDRAHPLLLRSNDPVTRDKAIRRRRRRSFFRIYI